MELQIREISDLNRDFVFLIIVLIYLFLAVLGLHCCVGFSLIAVSGSYSLDAVPGFLIVVASFVERGI